MTNWEFTKNRWVIIFGLASFVLGLPGMVDNFAIWKQWIGTMSPEWSGFFVGGGSVAICMWLLAWKDYPSNTLWPFLKKNYYLVKYSRKFKALYPELVALRDDYSVIDTKEQEEVAKIKNRYLELQFLLTKIGIKPFDPHLEPEETDEGKRTYIEFMTICARDGDMKSAMTYDQ